MNKLGPSASARDWQRFVCVSCEEKGSAPKARIAKRVTGSSRMKTASARGEEVYSLRGNGLRELKTIGLNRNWRVIENSNLRSSDKSAGIPVINQIVQLLWAPPPNTLSMTSSYL